MLKGLGLAQRELTEADLARALESRSLRSALEGRDGELAIGQLPEKNLLPNAEFGDGPRISRTRHLLVLSLYKSSRTAHSLFKRADSAIDVTLMEPSGKYHACYGSNEVLSGERAIVGVQVGFDGLAGHGINIVQASASAKSGNGVTARQRGHHLADPDQRDALS